MIKQNKSSGTGETHSSTPEESEREGEGRGGQGILKIVWVAARCPSNAAMKQCEYSSNLMKRK